MLIDVLVTHFAHPSLWAVRDNADPNYPKLAVRDWALAIGGFMIAVLMTYIALGVGHQMLEFSINLTISLYTGLVFSLFSTFFYAKLVRDHKELEV